MNAVRDVAQLEVFHIAAVAMAGEDTPLSMIALMAGKKKSTAQAKPSFTAGLLLIQCCFTSDSRHASRKKNRRAIQMNSTSIFSNAPLFTRGTGLAAYFDAAGAAGVAAATAGVAALASSAFLSVFACCSCLSCFTCFSCLSCMLCMSCLAVFSVAGLASAAVVVDAVVAAAALTAGAGVLATVDAAGAEATAAGAVVAALALAGAAGVWANALPINTVEAINAVKSLFIFYILVWWCFLSDSLGCQYGNDGVKTYFDAALAEADAAAAFASVLVLFSALDGLDALDGLASGAVAFADADADADAAITFAAGADLATLAAAAVAAGAGLADAAALALAGVCANALPITTVEAMRAMISLFMIRFPICLGVCFCFAFFAFRSQPT